jgi:hypothetical protein
MKSMLGISDLDSRGHVWWNWCALATSGHWFVKCSCCNFDQHGYDCSCVFLSWTPIQATMMLLFDGTSPTCAIPQWLSRAGPSLWLNGWKWESRPPVGFHVPQLQSLGMTWLLVHVQATPIAMTTLNVACQQSLLCSTLGVSGQGLGSMQPMPTSKVLCKIPPWTQL